MGEKIRPRNGVDTWVEKKTSKTTHTFTLPRSEEDPTLMVTCKDIGGDDDGGLVTMAHCARVTGSRST